MEAPERILLVRPSALGDVCRTVPVLASLKAAWPDAAVDWLIQDGFVDAVRAHPDLHEAIPFPRRRLGRSLRRGSPMELLAWLGGLRSRRYDMVLDAQGLLRSGLIARSTRAPVRVGHRAARELAWLCYTTRERGSEGRHTVDRMLALMEALEIEPVRDMRLYAPEEDRRAIADDARFAGAYAVLAPTSRWPGKQWPADRFDTLAASLLESGRVGAVAVVGGGEERDQCRPLLARAGQDDRVIDLVGDTSIGRLMALIERAALVVANDSAALHMAVGFDRPLLGLYGPTRVDLVGPYRREADVIQHVKPGETLDHKDEASGRELMGRITADEVIAACLARLATG